MFCTFDINTLIWAGLKSIPEVVNSRLVVLVLRSLIMCPNLPLRVLDYCSSSILLLSSYSLLLSSNIFYYSFIFSRLHFLLYSSSLIFFSFYSICLCYRYFSSLILRISRTLLVLGSITSYVFFGLGLLGSIEVKECKWI